MLAHRRAEETKRLYRWEDYTRRAKQLPYTLTCERTMVDLNVFAAEVWEKHGRGEVPKISAWNGLYWKQYNERFQGWSYQQGKEIKLAKRHRNRMVVLHEITHALGHYTHGRGYVKKYAQLLQEYAGLDPAWMELSMGMFKIKLGHVPLVAGS